MLTQDTTRQVAPPGGANKPLAEALGDLLAVRDRLWEFVFEQNACRGASKGF